MLVLVALWSSYLFAFWLGFPLKWPIDSVCMCVRVCVCMWTLLTSAETTEGALRELRGGGVGVTPPSPYGRVLLTTNSRDSKPLPVTRQDAQLGRVLIHGLIKPADATLEAIVRPIIFACPEA